LRANLADNIMVFHGSSICLAEYLTAYSTNLKPEQLRNYKPIIQQLEVGQMPSPAHFAVLKAKNQKGLDFRSTVAYLTSRLSGYTVALASTQLIRLEIEYCKQIGKPPLDDVSWDTALNSASAIYAAMWHHFISTNDPPLDGPMKLAGAIAQSQMMGPVTPSGLTEDEALFRLRGLAREEPPWTYPGEVRLPRAIAAAFYDQLRAPVGVLEESVIPLLLKKISIWHGKLTLCGRFGSTDFEVGLRKMKTRIEDHFAFLDSQGIPTGAPVNAYRIPPGSSASMRTSRRDGGVLREILSDMMANDILAGRAGTVELHRQITLALNDERDSATTMTRLWTNSTTLYPNLIRYLVETGEKELRNDQVSAAFVAIVCAREGDKLRAVDLHTARTIMIWKVVRKLWRLAVQAFKEPSQLWTGPRRQQVQQLSEVSRALEGLKDVVADSGDSKWSTDDFRRHVMESLCDIVEKVTPARWFGENPKQEKWLRRLVNVAGRLYTAPTKVTVKGKLPPGPAPTMFPVQASGIKPETLSAEEILKWKDILEIEDKRLAIELGFDADEVWQRVALEPKPHAFTGGAFSNTHSPIPGCDSVAKALNAAGHVVIQAETGSGKSTLLIMWLAIQGYRVVVSQPRSLAASNVAAFMKVSAETHCEGTLSSYGAVLSRMAATKGCKPVTWRCYGVEGSTAEATRFGLVHYTTQLYALGLIKGGLPDGTVVVLDEAHEMRKGDSLQPAIIALLQDRRRYSIIMSADPSMEWLASKLAWPFVQLKDPSPFPRDFVEKRFAPENLYLVIMDEIRCWVERGSQLAVDGREVAPVIFVFGGTIPMNQRHADNVKGLLRESFGHLCGEIPCETRFPCTVVSGLHSAAVQRAATAPRFVDEGALISLIFTTPVAETSITNPALRAVIDCGLVTVVMFDPMYMTERMMQAAADESQLLQRKGRGARTPDRKGLRVCHYYLAHADSDLPRLEGAYIDFAGPLLLHLYDVGKTAASLLVDVGPANLVRAHQWARWMQQHTTERVPVGAGPAIRRVLGGLREYECPIITLIWAAAYTEGFPCAKDIGAYEELSDEQLRFLRGIYDIEMSANAMVDIADAIAVEATSDVHRKILARAVDWALRLDLAEGYRGVLEQYRTERAQWRVCPSLCKRLAEAFPYYVYGWDEASERYLNCVGAALSTAWVSRIFGPDEYDWPENLIVMAPRASLGRVTPQERKLYGCGGAAGAYYLPTWDGALEAIMPILTIPVTDLFMNCPARSFAQPGWTRQRERGPPSYSRRGLVYGVVPLTDCAGDLTVEAALRYQAEAARWEGLATSGQLPDGVSEEDRTSRGGSQAGQLSFEALALTSILATMEENLSAARDCIDNGLEPSVGLRNLRTDELGTALSDKAGATLFGDDFVYVSSTERAVVHRHGRELLAMATSREKSDARLLSFIKDGHTHIVEGAGVFFTAGLYRQSADGSLVWVPFLKTRSLLSNLGAQMSAVLPMRTPEAGWVGLFSNYMKHQAGKPFGAIGRHLNRSALAELDKLAGKDEVKRAKIIAAATPGRVTDAWRLVAQLTRDGAIPEWVEEIEEMADDDAEIIRESVSRTAKQSTQAALLACALLKAESARCPPVWKSVKEAALAVERDEAVDLGLSDGALEYLRRDLATSGLWAE
jgi:hypothetical protein